MKTEIISQFKNKMNREPVFGVFSKTKDPAFIEAMGYAGFDFVIIDLEHGPNSVETAQNLVRAAEVSDLFPIIRVKDDFPPVIGESLDIGAGGIEVPQICSKSDAENLVNHAKFAPLGMRGVCRYVRAAQYTNVDKNKYLKEANETIIVAHLEGEESLVNLEEICSVKGLDVLFLGPYDLSQSMGIPGEVDHPDLIAKMKGVVDFCSSRNILVGTFVDNREQAERWINAGVRYIAYSVDVGIFYESCSKIVSSLRA